MKLKKYIIKSFAVVALAIVHIILGACSDEFAASPDYTVAGKETVINLTVSLPEMHLQTRAALTDDQKNKVFNVWIRSYSSAGEATSDWYKIENLSYADTHIPQTISDFKTKTGPSYIVAVANIDNPARKMNADGSLGSESTLRDLLESADSWSDFTSIIVDAPDDYVPNDVNNKGLPMTGCYVEDTDHGVLRTWGQQNFTPFFIPYVSSGETLKGCIHLRRVASHVVFNLTPGTNARITPHGFRIVNIPRYAYAYERDENNVSERYPNYGDRVTATSQNNYYATTQYYDSRYFNQGASTGSYTFDFWQAENKQKSEVEACTDYNSRELEHKTDVPKNDDGSGPTQHNEGVYVNLTGSQTWTPKNMATFVEIECLVERADNKPFEPIEGIDNAGSYGDVVFTVHLGYCEGESIPEKAKDFNCRRNTEYTYNVIINDVNNIYVEALRVGENQPGMEGTVNDVEEPIIELDAHYAMVPIVLTEAELKDNFGFTIEARDFNGNLVTFDEKSTVDEKNEIFTSWIEIAPTPSGNELAAYAPDNVYTLKELKDAVDAGTFSFPSDGRYTLFINEYAYETSGDESGGNWKHYVNKPDRRVWIRTRVKVSNDGQSNYMRSKYAITQKSIQTYYDSESSVTTALGVEHLNESFGLTLAQSFYNAHGDNQTANIPRDNARYQTWYWLNSTSYPYNGTLQDYSTQSTALRNWEEVVDFTTIQDGTLPKGATSNSEARVKYNVPKIAVFNTHGNTTDQYATNQPRLQLSSSTDGIMPWDWQSPNRYSSDSYLPNTNRNYWIEGINACINRNRDNNGDGKIDASELRWFVPDEGKYIRMIVGRKSLSTPLMPYDEIPEMVNKSDNTNMGQNPQYLLYATGRRYLFANEGLSTQIYGRSGARPWQVRCVRNLGTNLNSVPVRTEQAGTPAYIRTGRIVRMSYYDQTSIRTTKYVNPLPTHYIYNAMADYNMLYKAFEIAPINNETDLEAGTNGSTQFTAAILTGTDNPCSSIDGEGWRLPNQKELTIMVQVGAFDHLNKAEKVGSTTQMYYNTAGYGYAIQPGGTRKVICATRSLDGAPVNMTADYSGSSWLYRCVRDVE